MCGVVGILSTTGQNCGVYIYDALNIIQHRGQDAAGITTFSENKFFMRKANGLVRNVFRTKHITALKGTMGIGHVRYPTAGSSSVSEAQPFYVNSPYGIAFAHNGNLTNTGQLTAELFNQNRRHINTKSDSEVLLNIFAAELYKEKATKVCPEQVFSAIKRVNQRISGAYANVGMIANFGIFGFRDPHGIRPLILGKRVKATGVKYMLASESVALTALGYDIVRDIEPGEAIIIKEDGEVLSEFCADNTTLNPCIFEFVYFARPDSIMDNISVYKTRLRMGETLAKNIKKTWANEQIDVVVPIPDTSRTSALELANTLGVKYREGLIKNRYIARTFIMPGQKQRKKSVKQKLSAIELEFKDKTVLLVDDSIVRGTTSKQIVQMVRDAGAKRVLFASAAPAILYPNVYGIDMASAKEFVASGKTLEQTCQAIGADRLIYQELEDLIQCVRAGNPKITKFDCSCFDGKYLTDDIDEEYLTMLENSRLDKNKKTSKEGSLNLI
jgi:amidophosphoribosyltransferase